MKKLDWLLRIGLVFVGTVFLMSCSHGGGSSGVQPDIPVTKQYSNFGVYQPLPEWSDWCPVSQDPQRCHTILNNAVQNPSASSRTTVRAHGWQLWAGISAPLDNSGYDAHTQTSSMFGTTGCWGQDSQHAQACSGVFPLWLSWPNTGLPYKPDGKETKVSKEMDVSNNPDNKKAMVGLIKINRNFSVGGANAEPMENNTNGSDPDPTQIQTVNTVGSERPVYKVPAIAISKQCNLPLSAVQPVLKIANSDTATAKAKAAAWKALDFSCTTNGYPGVVCPEDAAICDGSAFVNQGDVMIATESLTRQAWDAVQNNKLYSGTSTLSDLYAQGKTDVAANQIASWFTPEFISTKHMYWPVKGCKPGTQVGEKGCRVRYGALPPWIPADFKELSYATNADYLGYEKWSEVVAIDSCGSNCAKGHDATLALAHVEYASAIETQNPSVYPVSSFVHLQVSEETLNNAFTATDRALLDQATIWAYGDESNGFEAGDFLVVVAMHITTKEIDTWSFQSVWWSPMNDTLSDCPVTEYNHCFGQTQAYGAVDSTFSGLDKSTLTRLDNLVGTTWRDNYLMTDSYGINYEIDGTPIEVSNYFDGTPPKWATQRPDGTSIEMLPVAMNPYIEPVIHPVGTNCQNCHRRAGAVSAPPQAGEYAGGVGRANYQNAQCPNLLGDYGMPGNDSCMLNPWAWNQNQQWDQTANNNCQEKDGTLCKSKQVAYPIVNTDLSWFVADGHVQGGGN